MQIKTRSCPVWAEGKTMPYQDGKTGSQIGRKSGLTDFNSHRWKKCTAIKASRECWMWLNLDLKIWYAFEILYLINNCSYNYSVSWENKPWGAALPSSYFRMLCVHRLLLHESTEKETPARCLGSRWSLMDTTLPRAQEVQQLNCKADLPVLSERVISLPLGYNVLSGQEL